MTTRDAVLLLVAGFFLAGSILFFPFIVDDAFIVARYAVNARDLGEWAFNTGEHVSALTSPLHGLLMIGLSRLGDPVPVYKVVSVLTVAAASAIAVRRYGPDRPEALLVAVVVVAPGMLLWTAAGLETPILMAIVTAMATVYATGSPGDPRPVVTLGILAGAAVLTRYDAVLFAGPVLLAAIVRAPFRYALSAMAVAALPVLAWFVYSSMRFGSILPTSFFVKTPTGALDVIAFNVRYMVEQLAIDGVAIMAAYVGVRLIVSGRAGAALLDEFRTRGGLHIALAAVLTYGATMATVHMMFAFRHFVPYLGAAAIALAYVARRADGPDNRSNPASSGWATVCALMILTLHAFQAHALYYQSLQGLGTRGSMKRRVPPAMLVTSCPRCSGTLQMSVRTGRLSTAAGNRAYGHSRRGRCRTRTATPTYSKSSSPTVIYALAKREAKDLMVVYGAHMPITSMLSRVTEARAGSCRRSGCRIYS